MKLNELLLAKAIAKVDVPFYKKVSVLTWEQIPHWKQLHYLGEARKIIYALNLIKTGEIS